jgi:hypothetical protein
MRRYISGSLQTSGAGASQPVAPTPLKQEEIEHALNRPVPRAAEERGPGEDPQCRPRSFYLPEYGEVYEHDTWALDQPDSRPLY